MTKTVKHNFFRFIVFVFLLSGCLSKPTKVIEQSVNVFEKNIVLLDTRSALNYASFHIEGSKNLLVEDFLILKNPLSKKANKKRLLDPDMNQTIERLAHKGVSPDLKIFLIGESKNSVTNKKWRWLLSYLEINDIHLYSLDEVKKMKSGRFTEAEKQSPWILKSSVEYQSEFIFKNAPTCFVEWSESKCK
jgi:hypothetical protein